MIFPPVEFEVADILVVVDVPDHPPGNAHVYEVAPLTATIEYVLVVPEQMFELPVIAPEVAGAVLTVIASVCTDEEPQASFAFTVIFPPVEPAVVFILVDVEVPDHPEGNVQVYDVA